jgi:hypothetical protein
MYFEQEIINGVLSHRGTPDSKWIPYTPEELTGLLKNYHSAKYNMLEILDMAANYDYLKSKSDNLKSYLYNLVY